VSLEFDLKRYVAKYDCLFVDRYNDTNSTVTHDVYCQRYDDVKLKECLSVIDLISGEYSLIGISIDDLRDIVGSLNAFSAFLRAKSNPVASYSLTIWL